MYVIPHQKASRILTGVAITIVVIAAGCERPAPTPTIPVTSQVSWWPYQKNLTVDALDVSRINEDKPLNLMNSRFELAFRLSGIVRGQPGWRPYIREVHIAEVRVNPGSENDHVARLVVTPVADVVEDRNYADAPIRWNVRFIRPKQTMGWGINRFMIASGQRTATVEVEQQK